MRLSDKELLLRWDPEIQRGSVRDTCAEEHKNYQQKGG